MFGSLNDFIQAKDSLFQTKFEDFDNQSNETAPLKYSRKKILQERKKRNLSGITQYKASDKSQLIENYVKKFPQTAEFQIKKKQQQRKNNQTARKPISQGKIISFFHGQDPKKLKDEISKDQLKRQHNLLRAIVRTKLNQQQKPPNTYYQDSFNRMMKGLKNIKIKPIIDDQKSETINQVKTNRSLPSKTQKRSKSQLNNYTRLQFENCLNWTKKHRKNGSFYAKKLGKNMQIVTEDKTFQNRKSLIQSIHERASSVL